jgi:hypothetical protein
VLGELMGRRLDDVRLAVMMLDGPLPATARVSPVRWEAETRAPSTSGLPSGRYRSTAPPSPSPRTATRRVGVFETLKAIAKQFRRS